GMIGDVPEAPAGGVELTPWIVTALPMPWPLALDLLCACVGKEMFGNGVLIGPTLAYWTRVLRFSGALVAREQIVPGLKQNGNGWRAFWQPVVTGADVQRLAKLERAMPAACRAIGRSADAPPDRPASEVLRGVLDNLTDYLVRMAVAGPVNPAVKGGRIYVQNFASLHDQWVHALQHGDGAIVADERQLAGPA